MPITKQRILSTTILILTHKAMIHIRQPFFSIATAAIFALLGLGAACIAVNPEPLIIMGEEAPKQVLWAFTGLAFVMAYFALVHLKNS